ncbi:MAG: metal ABC transporter permease [Proteobacteria bacterium]|nr:metal ABC transporter permease [Pseudomonadota bacterium]
MIEIIAPALIIGIVIAIIHGALGIKVLQKGIIFIDLAIAQIAAFGFVLADLIFHKSHLTSQLIALLATIIAALFFYYIEKKSPKQQEAIIGSAFVLFGSLTMLMLANAVHGAEEIKDLMSGQILFVTWEDIWLHLPIYIAVIAIWLLKPKLQNGLTFYVLFAIAVTQSVELVGVYVVFASLILPALAALKYKNQLLAAWCCGILSIFLGIFLSFILALPAGGLIVVCYVVIAALFKAVKLIKA